MLLSGLNNCVILPHQARIRASMPHRISRSWSFPTAALLISTLLINGCASLAPTPSSTLQPQPLRLSFDAPSSEFPGLQIGRLEQWSAPLAPGARIEVINPWGDVYIRHNRGGDRVGLSATVQRLGIPAPEERISIESSADHVRMRVNYPDGATPAEGFERIGRVDIAVLVPAGSPLEVHTADGSITGKRVRSNIIARSGSGKIDLSTTGWVDAASESGSIQLVMIGGSWLHPTRAFSESGDIAVEIPIAADMRIEAQAGREVLLAPEDLRQVIAIEGGQATGTWGKAGTDNELVAESRQGQVTISLYGWIRSAATAQEH